MKKRTHIIALAVAQPSFKHKIRPFKSFNQNVGLNASSYGGYIGGYTVEFEARERIIAGKFTPNGTNNIYFLYSNANYLTPNGEFKVAIGSKAILHCGIQVDLLPGTEIVEDSEFASYIEVYGSSCPNNLNRFGNPGYSPDGNLSSGIAPVNNNSETSQAAENIKIFPNPTTGLLNIVIPSVNDTYRVVIYDVSGKAIYSASLNEKQNSELDVSQLENGIYLITVDYKNFKLIINK